MIVWKERSREKGARRLGKREERLGAFLALLATRPEGSGPHPDGERLLAFHEGRLNRAQEEEVRAHVADCAACYELWMAAGDCVSISSEGEKPILARFRDLLREHFAVSKTGWIGAAGVLVAACLVLVVNLHPGGRSGFHLDEWAGSEVRGLVSVSPGGLVPTPPALQRSYRAKGFSLGGKVFLGEDLGAFSGGVRLAAEKLAETEPAWRRVALRLPGIPQACSWHKGVLTCPRDRQWLVALGHWSALVSLACDESKGDVRSVPESYWRERASRLKELVQRASRSELPPETREKIRAWVGDDPPAVSRKLCILEPVQLARRLLREGS